MRVRAQLQVASVQINEPASTSGVVRQLARFWVRFSAAVKVQPLELSRAGLEALAHRSIPDEKSLSRLRRS
jgi:hypothetical protein